MTRVLVIDDDASTAEMIGGLEAGEAFSVQSVDRGDEGMQMAADEPPDLIVLNADIHAGFTYCRRIRRNDKLSKIPMLLISERASDEQFVEHQRLSTRADEYLHKPLDKELLKTTLLSMGGNPEPVSEVDAAEAAGSNGSGNGNGNGSGPLAMGSDEEVPLLDPDNESQNQAREQQSMALMAKELQDLRLAHAKLLEDNERGMMSSMAAAAPEPSEEIREQVAELLSQCAVLEGEKSNFQERIDEMEEELKTLREHANEDEGLRADLEEEIGQYERQLTERDNTIAQLLEQVNEQAASATSGVTFEASIQAIDEALQTARQVIADLKSTTTKAASETPTEGAEDGDNDEMDSPSAGFEL